MEQMEDSVRYRVVARGGGAEGASTASDESRSDPSIEDAEVLREYFQLRLKLADFVDHWSGRDERFRAIKGYYPGARLLRQDPVECLFSFVCSSSLPLA